MDERDIQDVARLHRACLTDSLVGELGEGYVRAFYRFVSRSTDEVMATVRRDDGRIVAAAVVTLRPATFMRRLALRTPLTWHAATHAGHLLALTWNAVRHPRHPTHRPLAEELPLPEMILTFTDASERARGRGMALLAQLEDELRARQVEAYQVRTVLDDDNAALTFYARRGFEPVGVTRRLGTNFQVFTKRLNPR